MIDDDVDDSIGDTITVSTAHPVRRDQAKFTPARSSSLSSPPCATDANQRHRASKIIKLKHPTRHSLPTGHAQAPKRKGGWNISMRLSPTLSALLGEETMTRPQITKHIWMYIKVHKLQDPADRCVIRCDEKLKEVSGVESFTKSELQKIINQHVVKEEK